MAPIIPSDLGNTAPWFALELREGSPPRAGSARTWEDYYDRSEEALGWPGRTALVSIQIVQQRRAGMRATFAKAITLHARH
jgi:hypothetical protein